MTRSKDQSTSVPTAWSPLRIPVFRDLLVADLVSDIGAFMQTVGAAWLMTSLTTRVTYIALIQTASALPFFLLALPAGAIGDIFNRRKLILGTEIWMAVIAVLLAVATIARVMTPWILLLLTLALSLGDAVESPAWRAIFPDLVPKKDLSPALALNGIEFNLARAVGPGLAGLIIAAAGVGAAFILNAVSFLGVIFVIARWKHPSHTSKTPTETIRGGTLAAVRYVRYSPSIRILLVRAGSVIFCTSAFWALLPSVAKALNKGAIGYGLLLACFGTGAVLGAIALDRARATLSTETLLTIATLVFGAVVLATGAVGILSFLCLLMALAGAAWIVFMSLFNTLIQNLAPDWVRARVLAVYLFVFQGSVALGSLVWGYVADRTNVHLALLLSSVGIGLSILLRFPLPLATASVDLSSWNHWGKPALFAEPKPAQGPVLVTVEYTIDPKRASEFLAIIYKYQRIRRRDGAIRWGIFYDAGTSNRYLESFLLDSWGEHERQHDRFTIADRDLENQVKQFSLEPAKVKHYIHAPRRPPANQTSHETKNRR